MKLKEKMFRVPPMSRHSNHVHVEGFLSVNGTLDVEVIVNEKITRINVGEKLKQLEALNSVLENHCIQLRQEMERMQRKMKEQQQIIDELYYAPPDANTGGPMYEKAKTSFEEKAKNFL
jgi:hypothetical protein